MSWTVVTGSLAACLVGFPVAMAVGVPAAHAKPVGDHQGNKISKG